MTKPKNTPSHIVYQVQDGAQDQAYWHRVGAAWKHSDDKGFSIQLTALPIDGRLTIRELSPKEQREESASQ